MPSSWVRSEVHRVDAAVVGIEIDHAVGLADPGQARAGQFTFRGSMNGANTSSISAPLSARIRLRLWSTQEFTTIGRTW